MKKTIEKILKDIIDSTSITDMCDRNVCHWLQPVVDTNCVSRVLLIF